MKYKVQLFVGGSTFWFTTYATSNQQAEQNAKRVYPNATIIFTTATFFQWLSMSRIYLPPDQWL